MKRWFIVLGLLNLLLASCAITGDQYPENILEWHKDKKSPGAIVLHPGVLVGDWAQWQRSALVRPGQYEVQEVLKREVFAPKKDGYWRVVSTGDLGPVDGIPGNFYTRYHVDNNGEVKAAYLGFFGADFLKESAIEIFPALSEEIENNPNRSPVNFNQNPMFKAKAMELGRVAGDKVVIRTQMGEISTRAYVSTDARTDPEEGYETPEYYHWMFFISDQVPFKVVARIHFQSAAPDGQAGPNVEVLELIRMQRGTP